MSLISLRFKFVDTALAIFYIEVENLLPVFRLHVLLVKVYQCLLLI